MAWYIQRYGCFKDDNANFYQVEIYSETFNNPTSSDEFTLGADGCSISYSGNGKDIDDPIKSSECSFTFYSQNSTDDAFFLDIMNAQVGKYLLRIGRNTSGTQNSPILPLPPELYIWAGVLVLQETTLADDHYPQAFRMRAIDGLGLLKSFKVNELTNLRDTANNQTDSRFQVGVNGALSGSWYSHHTLVLACLRLLPTANADFFIDNQLRAFVTTYFNWWTDRTYLEEDDGFYNPMLAIFTRSDAYYTVGNDPDNTGIRFLTAYDVLKYILEFYNARISMSEGGWQIQQLSALAVAAAAGTPGPTVKAARFNRDATHHTGGSPFDATLMKGTLAAGYDCQRAEATFTFSPGTRDVVLTVQDTPNLVFGPGEEFGAADYDYALLGTHAVGINSQPTVGQYINTYVGGNAGDLITFTMDFGVKFTAPLPPAGGWLTAAPTYAYICKFMVFVRQDDYWLVYNPATEKYEWETSQQDVYANTSFGWYVPLDVGMNSQIYSWTLGGINTDNMEELPSNGSIKYHTCYRVIEIDPVANTEIDVTPSFTLAGGALIVEQVLDQGGNYGAAENFVTVGLTLFINGENFAQNIYFFEQDATDPTISGQQVEKKSMFFDGPAIFRKNNIFYLNNSGFLQMFQWGLTGSWYYRNNPNITHLLAQVIRGDEYLRLTNKQKIILNGKILRKETARPNPDPLFFHQIFRETITGFGVTYFLCNGAKFTARSGEWSGEWRSLDMTFVATGGKVTGVKINNHLINHIIFNNILLLEKDNNHHKV